MVDSVNFTRELHAVAEYVIDEREREILFVLK